MDFVCVLTRSFTHSLTRLSSRPVPSCHVALSLLVQAVGRDCCDRVSGTFSVTCKYWGENIPTRSAGLFMLSGEVLEDRHEAPYRKAVQEYLTAVNPGVQETSDSLLVVAMKYEDHIERQDERRRKAYIALLLTAALWPLVLVMLAAAQWAFDTVTGACASKPHHTQ